MRTRTESIDRCLNAISALASVPIAPEPQRTKQPDSYTYRAALIIKLATGLDYLDSLTNDQYNDALNQQIKERSPHTPPIRQLLFNSKN